MKHLEDDRLENEKLKTKVLEDERNVKHLEAIIEQRDYEITKLKQVISLHETLSLEIQDRFQTEYSVCLLCGSQTDFNLPNYGRNAIEYIAFYFEFVSICLLSFLII